VFVRNFRCGRDRAAATLWPYPADAHYFRAMSVLSGICALTVFAIEAYAIWFVVFANDMKDRDKFGILGKHLHTSCVAPVAQPPS
jgi:hypothetical protein